MTNQELTAKQAIFVQIPGAGWRLWSVIPSYSKMGCGAVAPMKAVWRQSCHQLKDDPAIRVQHQGN
jgi:hypothetical protein